MLTKFFLCRNKAQQNKHGERILLGNNTGGRVVVPRLNRFWGLHFNWTSFYIHAVQHTHILNYDLHKVATCAASCATWSQGKSAVHLMGRSLSHYVLSSNYDLEVAKSLSYHFTIMPKETTENHKHFWQLENQPKFELGTSWMQARSITTSAKLFSTIRSWITVLHVQETGQWQ